MADLFAQLAAPFPPERVSWRVGSTTKDKTKGMALAYIDARDVMDRLDTVVGPSLWQARYPFAGCCEIGIKFGDEWVWKSNGAGQTDVEAEKGQYSDAFKRAAVLWGIGRYLYDLASPWVPLVAAGNSYRISDEGMAELTKRLARDAKRSEKPYTIEDAGRDLKAAPTLAALRTQWESLPADFKDALLATKDARKAELTRAA